MNGPVPIPVIEMVSAEPSGIILMRYSINCNGRSAYGALSVILTVIGSTASMVSTMAMTDAAGESNSGSLTCSRV